MIAIISYSAGSAAGSMNRNGHLELPPVPMDTLEKSIKKEFQTPNSTPPPIRHRTSSEYDHVLLNPLYSQKNRPRSNTLASDQSSVFEDLGYSEVRGPARRSPSLHVNSVPSDTLSQRSHSPRIYHSKTPSNLSSSQPYLDEQGYAALEEAGPHVYDEMHDTHTYDDVATLSMSMKKNLVPTNELLLSASPYEMPAIATLVEHPSNVIKGSLLSPEHKFEMARSNPNLSSSSPKRGFFIPSQELRAGKSNPNIWSHEYRELEDIATRMYDSPRNAQGSVEGLNKIEHGHGYEKPVAVRETAVVEMRIAREYESPVITITGEGKHQYENPDLALEQHNMELETIPE